MNRRFSGNKREPVTGRILFSSAALMGGFFDGPAAVRPFGRLSRAGLTFCFLISEMNGQPSRMTCCVFFLQK